MFVFFRGVSLISGIAHFEQVIVKKKKKKKKRKEKKKKKEKETKNKNKKTKKKNKTNFNEIASLSYIKRYIDGW